jgi:tripartite-type tricarboxylate transporter receptor subunit TctC
MKILVGILLVFFSVATTWAGNWTPNSSVTIVVPFSAGGNADIVVRSLADRLSQEIGQSVVIENRAGAGGTIGAAAVAKAKPDGLTLALTTVSSHSASPVFYNKTITYNVKNDFEYVITLVGTPKVVIARTDVPANSIPSLIKETQKPQSNYFYGAVNGGVDYLYAEFFKKKANADIKFVPYKGGASAMTDLHGGHIQLMFDNLPLVLPHVRAGTAKLLAISWHSRLKEFPEVPTWKELGYPEINYDTWYGIALPKGADQNIVNSWNRIFNQVLRDKEVTSRLSNHMAYVIGDNPVEARQRVIDTWQALENIASNTKLQRE